MKNPMYKRLLRSVKSDWRKHIILFVLMSFMIGIASGIFVGNDSMMSAIDSVYEKYNREDGHFELMEEASSKLRSAIETEGISIYEQFYKKTTERKVSSPAQEKDSWIRLFKLRKDINKLCIMEGRLPEGKGEIAIDRMHADNNSILVGDDLNVGGKTYRVVGLIAASDYSCLFENNSDLMFDAINFDIGFLVDADWESIDKNIKYQYAFRYVSTPADKTEEKKLSDKLVEKLAVLAATGGYTDDKDAKINPMDLADYVDDFNELTDFVPAYANQAIQFAPDDLGKDLAMMNILVYVFIAVLTFVFAITTSNKIREEASVIGTLRATGYTRRELLFYYISIPVLITIISTLVGNVLGYTKFKDVAVSLYYNSYSLMTYDTLWNAKAFIISTFVPLIIIIVVNFAVIYKLLRMSPLRFLRNDLSTSKRKKARRLPSWGFLTRFRLRILFQNALDYVVLFLGIVFITILLGFSVGLPETLNHYKEQASENLIADYQYVLKDYKDENGELIESTSPDAERFSTTSLVTVDGVRVGEDISIYGMSKNSRYFPSGENLSGNEVLVSSLYQDKFGLSEGDTITLKEKYADKNYSFKIAGFHEYLGGLAVFIPNENYARIFGKDSDYFTGFLSSTEIEDLDSKNVYMIITSDDVLRLSNQLDHSMGSIVDYVSGACLIMGILIMYLLTKIIIEKNATSISMLKVLGYENGEVNSLYVRLTTLVVIVLTLVSTFIGIKGLMVLFRLMMYSMSGWFNLYISPLGIAKIIGIILVSYIVVSLLTMRQIKRIPLTEALKTVE